MSPTVLTTLLDAAAGWPVPVVLAVSAVLLMFESGTLFGMALPGTTLLVALGLWAHLAPAALVPAIVVAAGATITGTQVGWWRGRTGTGPLRRGPDGVNRWFAGRGPAATAMLLAGGHWAAAARPVLPRVAGGAGVPYRLAGPVLAVTGAAWATTLVLLGNRVGPHVLTHAGWAPIVLVLLLVGALVLRSRYRDARRRNQGCRDAGCRDAGCGDESGLITLSSPTHPGRRPWADDPRPSPLVLA